MQTGHYQVGDVFVERFDVTPLVSVQPGEYQLLTGAYTSAPLKSAGNERVPIGTAKVTAPDRLIDPQGSIYPAAWCMWVQIKISGEVKPGDEVKLNLNFTAARPLAARYGRIRADDGQRLARDG